jgi:chromosome segregation ATPase
LFAARRASFEAEVSALEQSIQALKDQLWGVDQSLVNRLVQIQLQEKHLKSIKSLADEGYAPKNQVLQMEQTQTELKTALSDLKSNQSRLSRSIEESQFRMAQRKQDYQKDVMGLLAEVKKEVQAGWATVTATTQKAWNGAKTAVKASGEVVAKAAQQAYVDTAAYLSSCYEDGKKFWESLSEITGDPIFESVEFSFANLDFSIA